MELYILNIGVEGLPAGMDSPQKIAGACVSAGIEYDTVKRCTGTNGAEDCYAVLISKKQYNVENILTLSNNLNQDCIAVATITGKNGTLIGAKAINWMPFNPDFFVIPW